MCKQLGSCMTEKKVDGKVFFNSNRMFFAFGMVVDAGVAPTATGHGTLQKVMKASSKQIVQSIFFNFYDFTGTVTALPTLLRFDGSSV
jgi:hypothetical protein